jgi:hypothetical protein
MPKFKVTIMRGDAWGIDQEVTLSENDFLSAADRAHWRCESGYAEIIRVEHLGAGACWFRGSCHPVSGLCTLCWAL